MRYLLPGLLVLTALSCSTPSAPQPEGVFNLSVEQSSGKLTFRRVANDSRCQREMVCVWEGDAAVEVELGGQAAVLHTSGRPQFPRSARLGGYEVELVGLTSEGPYVATFNVRKVDP